MKLTWQRYNPESTAERVLVLGGSLGGDTAHQWASVAAQLSDDTVLVFAQLPGQGTGAHWDDDADQATMEHLAGRLAETMQSVKAKYPEHPVYYAGLSLSGALGLYLARDHSDDVDGVVAVASSLRTEDSTMWEERATAVERDGTASLIEATQARWFTEDFVGYEPAKVEAIMDGLASTDDHSYAQLCRSLATHDITGDLQDLFTPVLFIAGAEDPGHSQADLEDALHVMPNADLRVIPDVAHQVPVAAPGTVADVIRGFMRRLERQHWSVYDVIDGKPQA